MPESAFRWSQKKPARPGAFRYVGFGDASFHAFVGTNVASNHRIPRDIVRLQEKNHRACRRGYLVVSLDPSSWFRYTERSLFPVRLGTIWEANHVERRST